MIDGDDGPRAITLPYYYDFDDPEEHDHWAGPASLGDDYTAFVNRSNRDMLWRGGKVNIALYSVGQPGLVEGMIPVWGSGRAAIDDCQNRRCTWCAINVGLTAVDVVGVGMAAKAAWKGAKGLAAGLLGRGAVKAARAVAGLACFPAGTPVALREGQMPIESVQAGDEVWAFDLVDGKWKLRSVVKTFEHRHDGNFVTLTVADDVIRSTDNHPFWVVEGEGLAKRPPSTHKVPTPVATKLGGRWVDAGHLRVGDVLLLRSGKLSPVTRLESRHCEEPVYNLHIEELNTYAVGASGVLVHNKMYLGGLRASGALVPSGRGPAGARALAAR